MFGGENMRNKLRGKIFEKFKSVADFCREISFSRTYMGLILRGEKNGSYKFWETIKIVLEIPDEDIEMYKKKDD